ncbi:MAG: NTP transferase domain-containing protein [Thermoanaerobaculia bacterium]|jgi:xanthine/CO dehydrogenase XdhC/CoxF family maturation factor
MTELSRISLVADRLALAGSPCALATILEATGSTYRRAGAALLVEQSGTMHGAISGGCLDADLLEHARAVMKSGVPKIVDYLSKDDDTLFGVAMGCGGELRILVEPVDDALRAALRFARENDRVDLVAYVAEGPHPATRVATREQYEAMGATARWSRPLPASREVFLFGAGPEAAPFCAVASELGWRVTLCDHRAALVEGRFPGVELMVAPVVDLVAKAKPPARAAAVVMMHNLPHDLTLLRDLLALDLAYLGVLGPKRRTGKLLQTLRDEGLDTGEKGGRIHAPVGLAIGAENPAEIALSMASEIQSVFTRSAGGFLRDKAGPIHDRDDASAGTQPLLGVPVAILAAGGSTRMGEAKQLLDVGGESMLRRAVSGAIAARAGEVIVVAGAHAEAIANDLAGLDVRVVVNRDWQSGIASSVVAAVGAAEESGAHAIVITLADQPFVGQAHIRRLASTIRASEARIVASAYPEGGGVPAAFDRELFAELKSLRGDTGARDLIRRLPAMTLEIPIERTADVDTREEYERLRASCGIGDAGRARGQRP